MTNMTNLFFKYYNGHGFELAFFSKAAFFADGRIESITDIGENHLVIKAEFPSLQCAQIFVGAIHPEGLARPKVDSLIVPLEEQLLMIGEPAPLLSITVEQDFGSDIAFCTNHKDGASLIARLAAKGVKVVVTAADPVEAFDHPLSLHELKKMLAIKGS